VEEKPALTPEIIPTETAVKLAESVPASSKTVTVVLGFEYALTVILPYRVVESAALTLRPTSYCAVTSPATVNVVALA
jgi:hypothetical protein